MVNLFTAAARFNLGDFDKKRNISLASIPKKKILVTYDVDFDPDKEFKVDLKYDVKSVEPGEVVAVGTSLDNRNWSWQLLKSSSPISKTKINIRFNPYMFREPQLKFSSDTIFTDLNVQLPACFEITSEELEHDAKISFKIFLTSDKPLLDIPTIQSKIAAEHTKYGILVPAVSILREKEAAPLFRLPIDDPNAKELFLVCEAWTGENNSLVFARQSIKLQINKSSFKDTASAKKKITDMYAVVKDVCDKTAMESDRTNLVAALKKGSARFTMLVDELKRLDAQMKNKFLAKQATQERYTLAANLYQYEDAAILEFEKRIKELVEYSKELDSAKSNFTDYIKNKSKQFLAKSGYPVADYIGFLARQQVIGLNIRDSITQFNRANQFISYHLPSFEQTQYIVAMDNYAFKLFVAILETEKFSIDHLDAEMLRKNSALMDLMKTYHKKKSSISVAEQERIIEMIDKVVAPGFDYDIHSGSILANANAMVQLCADLQKAISEQISRENYLMGLLNAMIRY